MRATAETIWSVPAYLPYVQPPLTADAIADAELKIGHNLPDSYLALLRRQNGGHLRFGLPESPHHRIDGIGPHFPTLTSFNWDDCQEHVSYPLNGLVPFDGDGHWHLCLDYRTDERAPAVTMIEIELDEETRIADSFADYLGRLRLRVEGEHVLEAVPDLERLKAELSRHLHVSFDPTDTWAHGYSIDRACLGPRADPEWLWISPNTVPRGFVRMDDRRYASLKDLLPGVADRFPGLPAGSYLISATEKVRTKVFDACGQAGCPVRPLTEYVSGDSPHGV